jgi:hypothetical protein
MADKKKKKEDSLLVDAAETVGAVVGKIAALVGAAKPATAPTNIKIPKLAKKHKPRLPRKEKKAQKKATLAATGKQGSPRPAAPQA